jgi:hypothetical protein
MPQHALQLVDETTPATPPETVVEQIAASGYPITLMSGQTVALRYSMLSLRRLEARFGSLVGISAELNKAQAAMNDAQQNDTLGASGPVFTILSDAVACGLVDVRVIHPDTGQRVRLGDDVELLMEQLDPSQLQQYLDAFARALGQAFGSLGKEIAANLQTAASSSLGDTGTTSQPSSQDAPMNSSGP